MVFSHAARLLGVILFLAAVAPCTSQRASLARLAKQDAPDFLQTPEGYNCEPLQDGYQVRWRVIGDTSIAFEVLASIAPGEYMGFGPSGSTTGTQMVGSDPVIADTFQGTFRAVDYYMSSRAQCSAGDGVCPDQNDDSPGSNDVTDVSGEVDSVSGITLVRYTRPLAPADVDATASSGSSPIDVQFRVGPGEITFVSWAIGPLSDSGLPMIHPTTSRPGSDVAIEFGRETRDNCAADTEVPVDSSESESPAPTDSGDTGMPAESSPPGDTAETDTPAESSAPGGPAGTSVPVESAAPGDPAETNMPDGPSETDGPADASDTSEAPDSDDTDEPADSGVCFPGTAMVELENGEQKQMTDLEIGDRIRTGPHPGEFGEVFFFSHRDHAATASFVNIVAGPLSLALSPSHLLLTTNMKLIAARNVKVGTEVWDSTGNSQKVTMVTRFEGRGLYAPHTLGSLGTLVVDGILASEFTQTVAPELARWLLSPLKTLYKLKLLRGCLGSLLDTRGHWAATNMPRAMTGSMY